MSVTAFTCGNEERRERVAASALNGIDYLEVANDDQTVLEVHFLKPITDPLTIDNVVIEGGVRVRNVKLDGAPTAAGSVLTVTVAPRGDFSTYRLRLVAAGDRSRPPTGYDPVLSQIEFSFKVGCPTEFDCREVIECADEPLETAEIDYLAKDYARFRRVMLDRLSITMPDWKDRSAADVQVAMVEALAYVADQLSYYQDAVATEAYLFTARTRTSVRRHARLLDYFVDEGANARTWIAFLATSDGVVPRGARVIAHDSDGPTLPLADFERLSEGAVVFETVADLPLRVAHNAIPFYTWSDTECCLAAGSARATLERPVGSDLKPGSVLVFEEILDPETGSPSLARRDRRHAVRLSEARPEVDILDGTPIWQVEWDVADALPFSIDISAPVDGASQAIAVARGNVVLADHGRSFEGDDLLPNEPEANRRYRPKLRRGNVSFAAPWDPDASATAALRPTQPRVAEIYPIAGSQRWEPRRDLLNSGPFSRHFVPETETDGSIFLRFGDGTQGLPPTVGTNLRVAYRIGNGTEGNVGPDALNCLVDGLDVAKVWNPLPAVGGRAPESLEQVRTSAPQAFRQQLRAVTEADWVEVAERHPEVQRAYAEYRWTGSWYTAFLSVDRVGGGAVLEDPKFRAEILAFLDRFRIAGYDLELRDPQFVPLEIELEVCIDADRFQADVRRELAEAFSANGFFHPDRFSFGDRVYLSEVLATAANVDGVTSVYPLKFQRWGKAANGETAAGFIGVAPHEIIRCDTDPNQPENGRVSFRIGGGL